MECLRDYITITTCGEESSTSGLSFDVLELVNLRAIASIADEQQETYNGVMNDIQNRAILRFKDDVRAEFWKKYKIKNLVKSYNLRRDNLNQTLSNVADSVGLYVSQNDDISSDYHKPFQSIFVQSVSVWIDSQYSGNTFRLKIIDLDTTFSIYLKDFDAIEGWNTINVETDLSQLYYNNPQHIYIGLGTDGSNVASTEMVATVDEQDYCGLTIQGAYTATKNIEANISLSDLTLTSNTYGMSAVLSLRCSYGSVVCNNRELFKRSWLYCLGIEFIRELLSTDRLNKYSLINRQKAAESLERFTIDYKEALLQTCDGIDLSQDNCCIECNAPITIRTTSQFF